MHALTRISTLGLKWSWDKKNRRTILWQTNTHTHRNKLAGACSMCWCLHHTCLQPKLCVIAARLCILCDVNNFTLQIENYVDLHLLDIIILHFWSWHNRTLYLQWLFIVFAVTASEYRNESTMRWNRGLIFSKNKFVWSISRPNSIKSKRFQSQKIK